MSSISVPLGGVDYEVPKLNIGQLEEVTVAFDLPPARRPFAILKIAMKRAVPAIPDFGAIEAGNDEIANAVRSILGNSGFETKKDTTAPNPEAPKEGAAS